ncbi:RluA family pseudouridine synthase [Acidaminococcus massiliensis]|uniref:RluA family pseudouridine synthase n=1 Tax=Acidaminococcus massiliensis TaxID=1852375 RepID=UPI0026DAF4EF|nr:RluA family pseudouridine synthase [Acidaminococcus massiliensis]
MELTYQVDRDHAGCCVRQAARGPMHLSEKLWRKIKWNGTIIVNGSPVSSPSHRLEAGDWLVFRWEETAAVIPVQLPLSILYEDEDLLAVDKPAAMLIHPTWAGARDTLVQAVGGYFRRTGQACGIHPLYRLDRDTTGILLVAKSAFAKHALTKSHSQIYREYLAICEGRLEYPRGRIAHPIGRAEEGVDRWTVRPDGRPAVTDYEILAEGEEYTVLRIHLLTGRTHQIRVHFAHEGHPLLGDPLYGKTHPILQRQALHAWTVRFCHPRTGKELYLQAPVPGDMRRGAVACAAAPSAAADRCTLAADSKGV